MLMKLFTIIEYGNSIRGPTFIADQRKVKKVQRRATCSLLELIGRSYDERLRMLQLPSLALQL